MTKKGSNFLLCPADTFYSAEIIELVNPTIGGFSRKSCFNSHSSRINVTLGLHKYV